jgi:hypothetical protein
VTSRLSDMLSSFGHASRRNDICADLYSLPDDLALAKQFRVPCVSEIGRLQIAIC